MSTATATETTKKLKLPSQWNVVLKDDDVTPLEYIAMVIQKVFDKTEEQAIELVRQVNNNGRAVVYTSTLELCRAKVDDVNKLNAAFKQDLKAIKEQA